MAQNLRDRLRRIRSQGSGYRFPRMPDAAGYDTMKAADEGIPAASPLIDGVEEYHPWTKIDTFVEKRTVRLVFERELPDAVDSTLACLVPDAASLFTAGPLVDPGIFSFFDLETTGLSGGAGTVAFLASIGRFDSISAGDAPVKLPSGPRSAEAQSRRLLQVTQFLLLDFPGEGIFWELILDELNSGNLGTVLVSYNGKAFDHQIMRNRCLMNGIRMPMVPHLDLLPTARALWRHRLPSCRLTEIETSILGLTREDDLPGSEAPVIWFDFLKTGQRERLEGIARHNVLDILGLASLLAHLVELAADPVDSTRVRPDDFESFVLRWHGRLIAFKKELRSGVDYDMLEQLDALLVDTAVAKRLPRLLLLKARELRSLRKWKESKPLLEALVHGVECPVPPIIKALASRLLAIDCEWRLKDVKSSLEYVETALFQTDLPESLRADLLNRKIRLEAKKDDTFSFLEHQPIA